MAIVYLENYVLVAISNNPEFDSYIKTSEGVLDCLLKHDLQLIGDWEDSMFTVTSVYDNERKIPVDKQVYQHILNLYNIKWN